MQQAVYLVKAAFEGFYVTLSDEQKAQFEAIGGKRTASLPDRSPSLSHGPIQRTVVAAVPWISIGFL